MPENAKTLWTPPAEIAVANAHSRGVVHDLQDRFSNEIGFIPRAATEWYIDAGRVLICTENGTPCGMLLGRDSLRWNIAIRPITQAAVYTDAQRRHHGLALVRRVADEARNAGQMALQSCCRSGIDANEFWFAAGFTKVCEMMPQTARRKAVICWRLQLDPAYRPLWFNVPPPVAGYRATKVITR
jgi:GNAT superfamily N-acetyltransferase